MGFIFESNTPSWRKDDQRNCTHIGRCSASSTTDLERRRYLRQLRKRTCTFPLHPQQTLKGVGTATKSAVVGGSLGYIGWEKLTTDKSVVGIVSDAVIGEDTTKKIGDTVSGIGDGVKDLKDSVTGLSDNVNGAISSVDSKWSGMSGFLRAMFSGHGGDMFGNFFSNIGKGNVSGLSLIGLIVSSLLVFGRFGWLGKIAGAVLGMMMIGNNANLTSVLGGNNDRMASNHKEEKKQQEAEQTNTVSRRR